MRHRYSRYFIILNLFAAFWLGRAASGQDCPDTLVSIDHIIWAVPDLKAGAAQFEALTGVTPVYGGEHTNGITANYLVSLGPCTYLEIIGPKEGVSLDNFGAAADIYKNTGLLGFAFGVANTDDAKAYFLQNGLRTDAPREGGRSRPDGSFVGWRTMSFPDLSSGATRLMFAIEWRTKPHPAQTAPKGAVVKVFEIAGPDAAKFSAIVRDNRLPVEIAADQPTGFKLVLSTPKGEVVLD